MDWLYSLVNTNQNIENIYKMKMINPYVKYNLLKSFFLSISAMFIGQIDKLIKLHSH